MRVKGLKGVKPAIKLSQHIARNLLIDKKHAKIKLTSNLAVHASNEITQALNANPPEVIPVGDKDPITDYRGVERATQRVPEFVQCDEQFSIRDICEGKLAVDC